MHAEIIAIGSELTTGAKLDTNSQWLSIELAAIGIPVNYHVTVADDLAGMTAVFRQAVDRSDLVLITGGLGPTLDDLTRQSLAALTQVDLVLHEESLVHIRSLFAKRNREMPERNSIQAMFPAGSEPLANPRGTAPGIRMEVARPGRSAPAFLAAMPGVPSEMKVMFTNEVLPLLSGQGNVIRSARVNCFGVGESAAEDMLGDLTARGKDPEVGITVHEATITLRITASGSSEQQCDEKISKAKQQIHERMGDLVFGEEDEELEHAVMALLAERSLTLATAESGTGGLLAHRLTEVPDYTRCYLGGVIAPTTKAKHDLLQMDPAIIEQQGANSLQTAQQMAIGCRNSLRADFALAVTECTAPTQEAALSPAPVAFIALAGKDFCDAHELNLMGDPAIIKSRTTKSALNLLRLHLTR